MKKLIGDKKLVLLKQKRQTF